LESQASALVAEADDHVTQQLIGSARLQMIAAVSRSALLFIYQLVVARGFGVVVYALVNLAQSGIQSATMVGRSAGDVIVLRAEHPWGRDGALGRAVTFSLVGGCLAGAGLFGWLLAYIHPDRVEAIALSAAAFAVPAAALLFPLGAALQREHRFKEYGLAVTLLDPAARLAMVGVAAIIGAHWSFALAAIGFGSYVSLAVITGMLRGRLRAAGIVLRLDAEIRQLVAYSGTTTLAAAAQTTMLFAVLMILTRRGDVAGAAVYAAAARLSALALWIQSAFAAPFLPRIPELARKRERTDDSEALTQLYSHVVAGVLWFNGPFLVGMIVAGESILRIFGKQFADGGEVLALLAASQWINSATALAEDCLPLGGRSGLALFNNSAALLSVVLTVALMPASWGAVGAAWVIAVTYALLNAVRSVQIRKLFGARLPMGLIARFGATNVLVAVPGFMLVSRLHGRLLPGFALGAGASLLALGLMWLMASGPDRAALVSLVRMPVRKRGG